MTACRRQLTSRCCSGRKRKIGSLGRSGDRDEQPGLAMTSRKGWLSMACRPTAREPTQTTR